MLHENVKVYVQRFPRYLSATFWYYRVSRGKHLCFNWLWRTEVCKLDFVWGWFQNPEMRTFLALQPLFLKYLPCASYRKICKQAKKISANKSLNVPDVKLFSNFFFQRFWLFYDFLLRMTACSLHIKWFSGIRNLSGLNDLNSLNDLSGLNDLNSLISSKNLLSLIFPSTLTPKWPILVS